eukprot:g44996.t1
MGINQVGCFFLDGPKCLVPIQPTGKYSITLLTSALKMVTGFGEAVRCAPGQVLAFRNCPDQWMDILLEDVNEEEGCTVILQRELGGPGGWHGPKQAITLQAPEAEYEVLLLQFADGVIVTLKEAQDGHVTQALGGGVKMVGDQKVLLFVMYRVQVLYKMVSEPPLSLADVEEATSGAADTVDQVDCCAGEPLFNVEGLLWALNGGEGV